MMWGTFKHAAAPTKMLSQGCLRQPQHGTQPLSYCHYREKCSRHADVCAIDLDIWDAGGSASFQFEGPKVLPPAHCCLPKCSHIEWWISHDRSCPHSQLGKLVLTAAQRARNRAPTTTTLLHACNIHYKFQLYCKLQQMAAIMSP